MPLNVKFLPKSALLTVKEIVDVTSTLVTLGIDEIRVSGGEPTVRKEFDEIIQGLSDLPLRRLGMTTNGLFLEEKLPLLKKTICQHINISLDSLQKDKFNYITRTPHFEKVYRAIVKTAEMGFRVKVNVVAMRGINDEEVFDYLNFSARYGVEVRFLELMKIGESCGLYEENFISAQEMIGKIEERVVLTPVSVNRDSTSFNFETSTGARVGFIASESQPFCGSCSRLRLTATGHLRACLMSEAGISLKGKSKEEYPLILQSVMRLKPTGRIEEIKQPMYQIGG